MNEWTMITPYIPEDTADIAINLHLHCLEILAVASRELLFVIVLKISLECPQVLIKREQNSLAKQSLCFTKTLKFH